ncbi:hypothetical protein K505DRAFT_350116 [Melanomma pulvis-pyrius CBS 109.77]|uniref:Uncharacterized protein n=1 Tax=Melanomma pulvis-pyrius CBS 109.77 TaxID=1314802 RepID=A0A6A6X9S5_9PLEO|nr:hypothetical protein K505DRAFT_350116 [Melanomma pulvis-pyrius CBS 109.77]
MGQFLEKPCFEFQRGRCRRGNRCRFSHDIPVATATSPSTSKAHVRKETETEVTCRKWTYMIPRPNTKPSRFESALDTGTFFQIGWNLIKAEDAEIRQHVITKLGGEMGLEIIKTLTDIMDPNLKPETTISIFQDRTLPFYRIISHPDVLNSLILETPVDTIYTFLFGPSGRRCLSVFRFTASALSEMIFGPTSSDEELSIIATSTSLAVLDRLVEINQNAQVLEGLNAIVETIFACIPEKFMVPNAQQSLTRIKRRLNIGSSLPIASTQPGRQTFLPTSFELSQDLPGSLSKDGARHDNDHASIADIHILPTAREIASTRQEYIPIIDSTQHHLPGLAGLLDRQFRLLREDTVGQLRDAVREEVTRLNHPDRTILTTNRDRQNVRKVIYHHVRFSCILVDRRKGLQVVAEFDQPPQTKNRSAKQREDWWKGSKLLQVDSLVCFVSSHGKIIFLTVCDPILPMHQRTGSNSHDKRKSNDICSLFAQPNRASVLLSLAEYKTEDAIWISTHMAPSKTRQSLVEFPGVLLPSFQPTLQALQKMSRKLDLPFAKIIAPDSQIPAAVVKPPAYATKRGFSFNLDIIAGVPLALNPGEPFDFIKLNGGSTLDEAQQFAVVQALSTELTLVQGPPGTGKSYTGETIIKILLHNRKSANLGPIICVCYTNHALDQLLEHLVNGGVKQVIRLGSRSKSEILQNLTLHNVAKEAVPTKTEKHDKWEHNRDIGEIMEGLQDTLMGLNNPKSTTNIRAHLERNHYQHFRELFTKGVDEDGFREVKGKKFRVVEGWLRGAPKKLTSNRPISALLEVSLREMSTSERTALHKYWIEQRNSQLTKDLVDELDSYRDSKSALDKCHSELDLRCLRDAHIIGVTTSGLARNIELLQRVQAKVMLCEEAGEVLEAHTLTAILPGVEHTILIGDHEQLRPQINNFELQHDNPRGKKYSLDLSLFERLVKPQIGGPQVPLSTLKIQRRMHPSISELVRVPLYPDLRDHPSVLEYPEVDGMRDRLYWLDHQEKEDPRIAQAVSLSRTNTWEMEMVACLVSHLVKQGTYGSGDIAVITPYLGQLQKIKKRLANSFEIVVGDRDEENLEASGLQDDPEGASAHNQTQIQKTTLLNALRVATVDNFQGEEAKVIVVSLVRSNDEQKCGFLKTSNRINVLLSRARHGMYIIGNSDTSKPVPMWAEVLSILERSNNIGTSLALCCPRHKETPIEVSIPDDFARLAPEGGCSKRCSSRLQCGHACPNMCHSNSLHNAVRCLERCPRTKKGCEHECPRPCGDMCEQECQVILSNITLQCGHIAKHLKCHEAQTPEKFQCQVRMEQIMRRCKHKIFVRCYELPLKDDYICSATCGAALECGHNCNYSCKDCNIAITGGAFESKHGICNTKCGRPYTTCSHSCKDPCHGDTPCSLCIAPCEVSCSHSKCSRWCHEPCVPCAEDCSWSCPHRGRCPLPCAVPCNLLPCSERCKKLLGCGHQCPSICGEICPGDAYCQTCAHPKTKEMVVDFILSSTFEEVDLDTDPCIIPQCGHILTLESMDGHMSMSDFYITDPDGSIVALKNSAEPFSASGVKSCPTCRGPLRNLNRYGRLVRRALIDEATKKFIVWANKEFIPLVTRMQVIEKELRETARGSKPAPVGLSLKTPLSEPLRLTGTRDQQINRIGKLMQKENQYKSITNLRREIRKFLQLVNEREQPFGRIYDLAQDARNHRGINVDLHSNADILQVRNRILTTVLLIRCDYTMLLTFLQNRKGESSGTSPSIQVDFSINRKECEELIEESHSRKQPGNTVEGHLYWARFFALERSFAEPVSELLDVARKHLHLAHEICDKYPGQTGGMRNEIEDVERMLRDSTFYMPVSNEEKAAVFAAMAHDFRGTGHWYYCENGHPFTIGECGMPMETSQCPQCGSPVGGQHHRAVGGVRPAEDLEREFGGLMI